MIYVKNNNEWKHSNPGLTDLLFNGHKLLIKEAFEPKDINWEGFAEKGIMRLKGRMQSYGLTTLFALFSFISLFTVTMIAEKVTDIAYDDSHLSEIE